MKRTLDQFLEDNHVSFKQAMDMYYQKCIELGMFNMTTNAINFIINFQIEDIEAGKVYTALNDRFEYKCIV